MKKLKGGNDAKMECLPSRFAMATITKGDTTNRLMNNYGKKPKAAVGPGYFREMPGYTR